MKGVFFIITIIWTTSVGAQTLDDYVSEALANSPLLKAEYGSYEMTRQKVDQAGRIPDPSVGVGYFISPIETRVGAQQARISASQMLPWFGTRDAESEATLNMSQASFEVFKHKERMVQLAVETTYYELVAFHQKADISRANEAILQSLKSVAETKFETGEGRLSDILLIDLELSENQEVTVGIEQKIVVMETRFNQLLGKQDLSEKVIVADPLRPVLGDEDSEWQKILEANHELESLEFRQQAVVKKKDWVEKKNGPKIGLGVNYFVVADRTDMSPQDNGKDAVMPMVSLSLPLQKTKNSAAVKEQVLSQEVLANAEIEKRNALYSSYTRWRIEFSDSQRQMDLYEDQAQTAQQAQRLLIDSYSADDAEFHEILKVQRLQLKYQRLAVDAEKNLFTAAANIRSMQ